jgi:hypothetical protein
VTVDLGLEASAQSYSDSVETARSEEILLNDDAAFKPAVRFGRIVGLPVLITLW